MKKVILIILGLGLVSCAIPDYKKTTTYEKLNTNKVVKPLTRSGKYLQCVIRLNNEGLKQSLIKTLCDSTYGGLE